MEGTNSVCSVILEASILEECFIDAQRGKIKTWLFLSEFDMGIVISILFMYDIMFKGTCHH